MADQDNEQIKSTVSKKAAEAERLRREEEAEQLERKKQQARIGAAMVVLFN